MALPQVTSNPFLSPTDKEMIVTCIHETLGTGRDSLQGMLTRFSACWNSGNSFGELPKGAAVGKVFSQAAAEQKAPSPGSIAIQICLLQPHYRLPFKVFIFPSVK